MEDDDGPPMLVDSNGVDNEDANLNAEMEDVKVTKVPISIITGQSTTFSSTDPYPCGLMHARDFSSHMPDRSKDLVLATTGVLQRTPLRRLHN